MSKPLPGHPFPPVEVAKLGGGALMLGARAKGHDWAMVIVYRGLHCSVCKAYL